MSNFTTDPNNHFEAKNLLVGAEAIANFCGITKDKVYSWKNKGWAPIWNEPGLGVCALKTQLVEYMTHCPTDPRKTGRARGASGERHHSDASA